MSDVGTPAAAPPGTEPFAGMAKHAALLAFVAGLLAGLLTMTTDPIGVFYDDAIYLLTAKAIATGQGYVYPHLPGLPPAIHYPPGWPALLAIVWKLAPAFPASVPWFKLINPVLLGLVGAGMTVLGRRALGLPWWGALGTAIAAVTAVPVLVLANVLLSEPLFLALLFPALLVCERMTRVAPGDAPGDVPSGATGHPVALRTILLAAVLTAAILLTRTIAGVLFIAAVMVLLRDRRWRDAAIYTAVVVLLMLPWQLFVSRSGAGFPDELRGSYGPYLEWVVGGYRTGGWPFFRDVLVQNTHDGWVMLGAFVSPLARGAVRELLAALAVVTLVAALVTTWLGLRARVTALALSGYLVAVLMWPYQTERFLWAVWPWALLVTAAGAYALWSGARRRGLVRSARLTFVCAVILALGHETYAVRGLARGYAYSASTQMTNSTLPLVRYVLGEPRLAGRVIAADGSPIVALYSGITVVPVDILTPQEHLGAKSPRAFAEDLAAIDRRYRPTTYVFLPLEGRLRSLDLLRLDDGRRLEAVALPGLPLRVFDVVTP